jgi:nitrous oxide reductase accessory protein NosL
MKAMAYALLVVMVVLGSVTLTGAADDIKQVPSCKYCGMDRNVFAHSRTFIEYDDGKHEGFCSIHCAAVDLAVNIDKTPKGLFVGDYKTKDLIDAEKAVWVIGGSKPGVMTKRAKWAFKTKEDADAFITRSPAVRPPRLMGR